MMTAGCRATTIRLFPPSASGRSTWVTWKAIPWTAICIPSSIAATPNHWARGVDGIYLFNWPCKTWEGNRLNLDNLGDPLRLAYRDKLYALTRSS